MRIDTLGRRLVFALLAGILVVGVAACGGDDDDAADGGTETDTGSGSGPGDDTSGDDGDYGGGGDEGGGDGGDAAESEVGAITIEGFAFASMIEARPGAALTITNHDGEAHTVTADDGAFDVDVQPDGTAELIAPAEPGDYAFHCAIHSSMTSTLVVKAA
ncbi:MAG: cupredoxin domain-containing protein [Acidimicrobiales bacterium]